MATVLIPRRRENIFSRKRVAIAIDASGSVSNVLKVFATGLRATEVLIPMESGGSSIIPVNELAKRFDIVYFFTDGYFFGKPAPNVKVIIV